MNEVIVTIAGNVAGEVKHRVTSSGLSVTSFRLASTPRRRDGSGAWSDRATSFFTVTCWRALADNVAASVVKGQPVLVVGRLSVESWEREDRSGLEVTITADVVGHDLTRGRADFRKVARSTTGSAHQEDDTGSEGEPRPPARALAVSEPGLGDGARTAEAVSW